MPKKKEEKRTQPATKPIPDLPARDVSREEQEKTKGGRARSGPGTQTEDEIYVG